MSKFDFYPWWLSYGHIVVLIPFAAMLALALRFHWSRWFVGIFGVLTLWSLAAMGVARLGFNPDSVPALPTQAFLRSGSGRVLDIGAGTGRSSIMVLTARPKATLVASDLFGESFDTHFGKAETPQDRLRANLKAAGVDARATIETADAMKLPYGDASFDAIVSAYVLDHLGRDGADKALAEAARVVKPGGDFLLMLVANDAWAKFAFGPLLAHGGPRGPAWWTPHMEQAGFTVVETGTSPVTLYLLARR
jgi:SAM-dependent methyltransferase